MDANQSAFSAYKIATPKLVDKRKQSKKHIHKKKGLEKSPITVKTSHENLTPAKKRARPENLHDEGGPSYASSSGNVLNEVIGNGRAKVNETISTENWCHFLHIALFHFIYFYLEKIYEIEAGSNPG